MCLIFFPPKLSLTSFKAKMEVIRTSSPKFFLLPFLPTSPAPGGDTLASARTFLRILLCSLTSYQTCLKLEKSQQTALHVHLLTCCPRPRDRWGVVAVVITNVLHLFLADSDPCLIQIWFQGLRRRARLSLKSQTDFPILRFPSR